MLKIIAVLIVFWVIYQIVKFSWKIIEVVKKDSSGGFSFNRNNSNSNRSNNSNGQTKIDYIPEDEKRKSQRTQSKSSEDYIDYEEVEAE